MSDLYVSGHRVPGICDVCGFRYRLTQLKKLVVHGNVTEVKACPACWTPDQPQLKLGEHPVIDAQAVRGPRPDTGLSDSREIAVNVTAVSFGINVGYVRVTTT